MGGSLEGNADLTSRTGRLEFRVLGPLEVVRDGEPLKLAGARRRTLLALLLLRANKVVTIEILVEDLFGEQRSESAVDAVRVAVSACGMCSRAPVARKCSRRARVATCCVRRPTR